MQVGNAIQVWISLCTWRHEIARQHCACSQDQEHPLRQVTGSKASKGPSPCKVLVSLDFQAIVSVVPLIIAVRSLVASTEPSLDPSPGERWPLRGRWTRGRSLARQADFVRSILSCCFGCCLRIQCGGFRACFDITSPGRWFARIPLTAFRFGRPVPGCAFAWPAS